MKTIAFFETADPEKRIVIPTFGQVPFIRVDEAANDIP